MIEKKNGINERKQDSKGAVLHNGTDRRTNTYKRNPVLKIVLYVVLGILSVLCIMLVSYRMIRRDWNKIISKVTTKVEVLQDRVTSEPIDDRGPVVNDANLNLTCSDDSSASSAAAVRPAVVYIEVTMLKRNTGSNNSVGSSGVSFAPIAGGSTKNSFGSGIIFDPKGYILTNYHVIAGAESILVTPFGYKEEKFTARVVKTIAAIDLAVLKIDSQEEFPCATLGNSDLIEVTDTVIAIGSPFGLEHTVTKGIISDDRRDLVIDGIAYKDMIQTDAAINRGNSGGPLVNVTGEVIGINTAIYAPTGIFTGVGFAIPINKARTIFQGIY